MRDQQAPLEYGAQRHGYYYTDEAFELPTVMLTDGNLLALLVAEINSGVRQSQWGPNAEILEPADLRKQAAEWMESAATRYRGSQ